MENPPANTPPASGLSGNKSAPHDPSRRGFLKVTAAAGGALLVGFHLPGVMRTAEAAAPIDEIRPNAWIRIGRDDSVIIMLSKSEMGQGVYTAMPMLVAEELEVDIKKVHVRSAPVDRAYIEPRFGIQATGGSTSVRGNYEPLRRAGAAARMLLIRAAARRWGVHERHCRARNGVVIGPGRRRVRYGDLVEFASRMEPPRKVEVKNPKDFRLIGRRVPRLDVPLKCTAWAVYGIDVRIPGMVIASLLQSPYIGGKVIHFDAAKAKQVKGVLGVVQVDDGVAVVADTFWAAKKGRDLLQVEWDTGPLATLSSADVTKQYEAAARDGEAAVARSEGDADGALGGAAKRVEAVYELPFLAHATMEPMNCTAYVHHKGADIWVPTQSQEIARRTVARLTGKPPETIDIHTTFLGGGFGRRSEQDFVTQAVQIALYTGRPVKLIWTREDDMQHDFYRPATWNRLHAGLDAKGRPVAWRHRIVGPSIFARVFPGALEKAKGIDHSSVEGAANLRYRIPNLHVDWVHHEPGVPVGFWRSVGNSQNAFVTESFIDELAHAAGKDPYEYRRALLAGAPRLRHVLELAAVKARWDRAPPKGRHRGIAAVESFGSFVAQVAEVSVTDDGKVRVHRVVCAVDCGRVVNPDTVEAQMQSGIVYGLTAALHGAVTVRDGQVEQRNFPDYPMLRIHEMPEVEVHIVSSREAPGGVGEPGTPPIAPAVCNAIYAATGTRIRRLPIAPVEPAQRASKPSTGGTEAGRTGPTPR